MRYINTLTSAIIETDSHLEGGDWLLLEELEEFSEDELEEEQPEEEQPEEKPKKKGANKKK